MDSEKTEPSETASATPVPTSTASTSVSLKPWHGLPSLQSLSSAVREDCKFDELFRTLNSPSKFTTHGYCNFLLGYYIQRIYVVFEQLKAEQVKYSNFFQTPPSPPFDKP